MTNLTPEETLLWQCARRWRERPVRWELPPDIDWTAVVRTGLANRMATLLGGWLATAGLSESLPPAAARELQRGIDRLEKNAHHLGHDLRHYLRHAAAIGQEVIVLKGLWVSLKIYGQAALRPGGDIDVLLRERDIPASLRILEEKMGYGRWWRPLLDDRYYQRHHLHQQRCNPDRSIWFEPHWRLDHPYNRLTVDYDGLMDRTTAGKLWDQPVREMSRPDLLLSLAIHLVKHAVYLPSTVNRPDIARLILADGLLMYFVDVAEVIKQQPDAVDWVQTVRLARQWGAVDILGSVLRVCRTLLDAPVPESVLAALAVGDQGYLTRTIMNRLADYQLALYQGRAPSKVWALLLGYNASIIFRPIRLLDLMHYLFPGGDYLRRRYGRATAGTAVFHLLRASGQYLRVGIDTLFFTWRRRREVRALDRQGFVWPELPVEATD